MIYMKLISHTQESSSLFCYGLKGVELSGYSEAVQFAQILGHCALKKVDTSIPHAPRIFGLLKLQNHLLNELSNGDIVEGAPFTIRITGYASLSNEEVVMTSGFYEPSRLSESNNGFRGWETYCMDAVW